MKVRLVAVLSVFVLGSSASLANMLLLGAGGGSGGGGGGPTTVFQCDGTYDGPFNFTPGSPDGDGYRESTITGSNAEMRLPDTGKPTLTDGVAYSFTFDVKDSTATPPSTTPYLEIIVTDGTNTFGIVADMSNASIATNRTTGTGSVTSTSSSDLGSGKKRISVSGGASDWVAGVSQFKVHPCSDSTCSSTPSSGTFTLNASTCKITTP